MAVGIFLDISILELTHFIIDPTGGAARAENVIDLHLSSCHCVLAAADQLHDDQSQLPPR